MMCLRGSVCLYQGEELGFPEADVAFEDLQDPYGIEFWPEYKGRDGCRTPMTWDKSNLNAGVSQGKTWLPIASAHLALCVERQEEDPTSLLHHYRRAIAFRKAHPSLVKGTDGGVHFEGDIVYFIRSSGREQMFCAFNLSDSPSALDMPKGNWVQTGAEIGSANVSADGKLHLGPWQPCLALKAKA
jgi:alpha-glucosidase